MHKLLNQPSDRGRIVTASVQILSLVLVGVVFVFGSLVTLGNTASIIRSSTSGYILGFAGALLTLSIFVLFYWFVTPHQKMNRALLFMCFIWGGLAAAGSSMFVNGLNVLSSEALAVTVIAPIVEELTKALFLLFVALKHRSFFLTKLDAIIIAGFIGLGFAFIENVNYYFAAFAGFEITSGRELSESGIKALASSIAARTGSGLVHPFFTTITALFTLRALREQSWIHRLSISSFGLFFAMLLHSLWNLNAVGDFRNLTHTLISVFFAVLVATLASAAIKLRFNEAEEWNQGLSDLVALRVFTEQDSMITKNRRNQKKFLAFALRYGGERGLYDAKRLQRASIELTRWYLYSCRTLRLHRDVIANDEVDEEMGKLRSRVLYPKELV